MHTVGVDTLVNQVAQKEREHHRPPGDAKQGQGNNQGLIWNRDKCRIQKDDWNEPLPVVLVDVLKTGDEFWIFVSEGIATDTTKDVANEVGEECPDGQRENDPHETESCRRKDRGEGDCWYGQDDIKSSNHRNHDHSDVAQGGDLRLEVWCAQEIFSKEERAKNDDKEYRQEKHSGEYLFLSLDH